MDKSTPPSDITQSSFAAMGGVLFSRASGLVRTIIVNAIFGVTSTMDAFNAAFRLPNSLRDLFADGALSAAFMSALVIAKQKGHTQERNLIAITFGFFGILTTLLAILGFYFASDIISLITQNHFKVSGSYFIAVGLFKCLVFYLPITMINAVVMAVLGVHGQTFRAMNGSLFLSVGMIIGALMSPLFKEWGGVAIYGLAIGALGGAFLQMIYQMRPLWTLNLIPFPNFNPKAWYSYQPLRVILRQMAPRAIGQGALVLALSINTYFATRIGTGVLTYIVTAIMIIQVPIGLFGVATGFATLPELTLTLSKKDKHSFSRLLVEGLETSIWLATFTTVGFALLILPFYYLVFQHGQITFIDTVNNSIAICIYSTGIILASGNKVLINTLYALDATRQIVYNAIIYLVINTLLNILLIPHFGIIGIGFSFGVATSLDFWLNYFSIKYHFHRKKFEGTPYDEGGKYYTLGILSITIFGFLICLLGIWLIKHVWVHQILTISKAVTILALGGTVLSLAFLILLSAWGPSHLKQVILSKLLPIH